MHCNLILQNHLLIYVLVCQRSLSQNLSIMSITKAKTIVWSEEVHSFGCMEVREFKTSESNAEGQLRLQRYLMKKRLIQNDVDPWRKAQETSTDGQRARLEYLKATVSCVILCLSVLGVVLLVVLFIIGSFLSVSERRCECIPSYSQSQVNEGKHYSFGQKKE